MIDTTITHNAVTIALSTSSSTLVDLSDLPADALLFFDLLITGDGTVTVSYSIADTATATPYVPSGASDITTGHTKSSGTGGRDRFKIAAPFLGKFMTITITETGGVDPVVATGTLIILGGSK